MPKAKTKENLEIFKFLKDLTVNIVLTSSNGKIVFANDSANRLLGIKTSSTKKPLPELSKMASKFNQELIKDFPVENRILRFNSQPLDNDKIIHFVFDVTRDQFQEKQRKILEHTANIHAQKLPTKDWLQSILNKITVLLEIQSCSIMLFHPEESILEATISSSNIKEKKIQLKIGEGIAGLAAQKRKIIATTNTAKEKRYINNRKSNKPSSLLAIPMIIGQKLKGVLIVRDEVNRHFKEEERSFYTILANRLAITLEHRHLIEQLQEEYDRLAKVIYNNDQGMILLDQNQKILLTNPSFANIVSIKTTELKGKNIKDIIPEVKEILPKASEHIYKEIEIKHLPTKPWVGISISEIKRTDSTNTLLTLRDITAEKHLEKMKDDFVATATHELRTPLTAILGYLSMIGAKTKNLNEKQIVYLKRIGQAADRLFNLVEDLLSVLRIEQDRLKLIPEKCLMLPLIEEIVHNLEPKALHKNIEIKLPKKDFQIYTDPNAFQKAITNLIDNAIKYSRENGKITVTSNKIIKNKKNYIRIDVSDSGVGISKEEQSQVFGKFFRVQNEYSVQAGGTGLGLYISKKLAQDWGGDLWLEKSTPSGSTFSFIVPAI